MLFTTEKRDISSTKSLQFDKRLLGKSFTWMENNKGSTIKPCGTPAVALSQDECWTLRTTRCFWQETKSRERIKRLP